MRCALSSKETKLKYFAVQTKTGDFVSGSGSLTEFASEALAFPTKEAAIGCSSRFAASRIVELSPAVVGQEFKPKAAPKRKFAEMWNL